VRQLRLIVVEPGNIHSSSRVGLLVRLWCSRSHGEFSVWYRRGEEAL
jgi:hypothetical protein